jgi:hypothetical protein
MLGKPGKVQGTFPVADAVVGKKKRQLVGTGLGTDCTGAVPQWTPLDAGLLAAFASLACLFCLLPRPPVACFYFVFLSVHIGMYVLAACPRRCTASVPS